MEQFWTIFWSAVGVILTGLASWAGALLTQWLNSKVKDKKLREYANAITDIIFRAVNTVTQTYVSDMKKKNAFDADAQGKALQKCVDIVKSQLTNELTQYLKDNFNDVEAYITSSIEALILSLKN